MNQSEKIELIKSFMSRGVLISKQMLESLSEMDYDAGHEYLSGQAGSSSLMLEMETPEIQKQEQKFREETPTSITGSSGGRVDIVFSYQELQKKIKIDDFISYFNSRFKSIRNILVNRQELSGAVSINRVSYKSDKENVALIGMVKEKAITKNNNVVLVIEDTTGEIAAIVNKNNQDVYELAKNIVEDETIGITGIMGQGAIFVNNILLPDVPFSKELKKSNEEEYVVFLSDLHVGSNNFLSEEFSKFIKWINGGIGNESQKEVISKIKYLFILGDLVDGVGIYPGQEQELAIKDIYEQYKLCASYIKQIPLRIKIIICPGNHDAMRISEPQPPLYKDYAAPFYEIENAILVSNPAIINIGRTKTFSGFDVLMYHGYSFDHYISTVDEIRNNGGYDRADLVMKFLLQRRHLAPTHASTLYMPDDREDPLVIQKIPDFFVTGHLHKTAVANYRGITLISGSCWQSKTAFQEKVGHHPEPCRVPLVNLQTREVRILRF